MDVIDRMDAMASDAELLTHYAATGAPADLTALVHRYVDLVYSAARRQLGDAHAAQDVTQQVFVVLLRKGRDLPPQTVLAAWLLKVTALECRNALKAKHRRMQRERKVAQMRSEVGTQAASGDDVNWDDLAPHLDAALGTLSDGDREAVVMRYFLNRSYEEAAALLGASEGSVRQRVYRGLEKIRAFLGARGVIATETALCSAILTHAVKAAPVGVGSATVAAVGKAALTKAAISKGVLTIMSASSPAKIGVAVLLVVALGLTAFLLNGRGDGAPSPVAKAPATTQVAPTPVALPAAPQAVAAGPAAPAAPAAPAKPAAPAPPPRKLFDVITARSCNARQGPRDGYDHIAFINRGDWLEYDDVEFPPADQPHAMAFCAVVACPAQFAGQDIEVHLGAPDGPKIATLTVESTAGYTDFVCQQVLFESPMGGTQDVFLVFTGGGFNVRSIKFAIVDGRTATDRINATGYAMAKKVNEGASALANIRDGAWARYDCMKFPKEGCDSITLAYAVDAAHAGGTISVRIGLPTAKPVCEIPIVSTGGYNRFVPFTLKLNELVKENHDVYLTFSGTNKGYFGLADVAWFSLNTPGTAKLSPLPLVGVPPKPAGAAPATSPAKEGSEAIRLR